MRRWLVINCLPFYSTNMIQSFMFFYYTAAAFGVEFDESHR